MAASAARCSRSARRVVAGWSTRYFSMTRSTSISLELASARARRTSSNSVDDEAGGCWPRAQEKNATSSKQIFPPRWYAVRPTAVCSLPRRPLAVSGARAQAPIPIEDGKLVQSGWQCRFGSARRRISSAVRAITSPAIRLVSRASAVSRASNLCRAPTLTAALFEWPPPSQRPMPARCACRPHSWPRDPESAGTVPPPPAGGAYMPMSEVP